MNIIDMVLLGYLIWGGWRGARRRLGRELEAFIKLALILAWVWGFGVFDWLKNSLDGLLQSNPVTGGMLGSLVAVIAAIYLLHLLREQLADAVEARISPANAQRFGLLTGLLRTGTWGATVIILISHVPWLGDLSRSSLSGHWLGPLLAV